MALGDDQEKVRILQADAENGEPRAQRHLANRYLRGRGVDRDAEAAAHWMRRAAEAGLPQAQRGYGEMLEQGLTGPADPEQARKWFQLAAKQGDPIARKHLDRLQARDG